MLSCSCARFNFLSTVDVKQGGGCSAPVVYTELVQCGSERMQLNLESGPDTQSVPLQTSVSRSGSGCRLQGRAPRIRRIKSVQRDVRKTWKPFFKTQHACAF